MELLDTFQNALSSNLLVEVYTPIGLEDGQVKVGFIVRVHEDFIVIQEVAQDGSVDGLSYIPASDICFLSSGSQYLNKPVFEQSCLVDWPRAFIGVQSSKDFFNAVRTHAAECSIHIRPADRMLVGRVTSVSNSCVTIAELDRHNQPDGQTTVPFSIIREVGVSISSIIKSQQQDC